MGIRGLRRRICSAFVRLGPDADDATAGLTQRAADRAERRDAVTDRADANELTGDGLAGDAMARFECL